MKHKILLALSILALPIAYAENAQTITMINHFNKPIRWIVSVNADVLPGLTKQFMHAPSDEIKTEVLNLQKEAYLSGKAGEHEIVFWGIENKNHKLGVHGYHSLGIAYSWTQNTITFCTPEEYRLKSRC